MDSLIIRGGKPIIGKIKISGSKNATLPILLSTLLTTKNITIANVPKLKDIYTALELIKHHGGEVSLQNLDDELSVTINCCNIDNFKSPYEIVKKMRASIWALAPILTRFGVAKVSLPGGCAIGARQVDLHLDVLRSMGASITIEHGYINAKVASERLEAIAFHFDRVSVGATITGIMAAVFANGTTTLSNCAIEPEISDLCNFLNSIGAKINNIGSKDLYITGVESLGETKDEYRVIEDRIEAGTYMIGAIMTKGNVDIIGASALRLGSVISKLQDAGALISIKSNDVINVRYNGQINSVDMQTNPYPGFPTDLQAQFMALMTISNGTSTITENIFENRFMHVLELCRMGADIQIQGKCAIISGIAQLSGSDVIASDLRASGALVLSGLVANGYTKIARIYHLDRGYQDLEHKLSSCGAEIKRNNT
ncbi:MAG: UDP-N-acetylglucosamine 1-carboxyvinyltransferase [Rickettsiaceae bacterium]